MADKPFDRTIINVRERPSSSDVNGGISALQRGVITWLAEHFMRRPENQFDPAAAAMSFQDGFFGQAYMPFVDAGAFKLKPGFAIQFSATQQTSLNGASRVDDLSSFKLLATEGMTLTPPMADPFQARVDLLEVRFNHAIGDPSSRDIMDPVTGAFLPNLVNKTVSHLTESGNITINGAGVLNWKTGTPGDGDNCPALSAGYLPVAQVYRPANSGTTITEQDPCDIRPCILGTSHLGHFSFEIDATGGGASPISFSVVHANHPPGTHFAIYTRKHTSGFYAGRDVFGLRLFGAPLGSDFAGTQRRNRCVAHAQIVGGALQFDTFPTGLEPYMLLAKPRAGGVMAFGNTGLVSAMPVGTYIADEISQVYPTTPNQMNAPWRSMCTVFEWVPVGWDASLNNWDRVPVFSGGAIQITGTIDMRPATQLF